MTLKFKNVYINDTVTVTGPYEKKGPLGNLFDKSYEEFYLGLKTWESAESKMIEDSVNGLLSKTKKSLLNIDLFISGDLLNQLVASNYAAINLKMPFLGVYSACATSVEGLIIGASMIDSKQIKNCICNASSHNNAAEKQFRYPVEYGGPKPKTTTFTTTGAATCLLSSEKSEIRVESGTIGIVNDMGVKDVYNMGAVMAPAFCDTLYQHLSDLNRNISYYDLILSGDLGIYGKKIAIEYMKKVYNINLNNYDDTGTMIYDLEHQPVYAGGSGPACSPLVLYSLIIPKMKSNKLKHVLMIATGALLSPTKVNEKDTIPAIAHAISLEVVK